MASTVTKNIDPDSGSGYDYDSVYDWEAAQQGDLTGARDEIAVARCRCTGGTADTTAVTINGWTTSATQYIKIWTDTSESYRHNGTYQTGNKYRLVKDDNTVITNNEEYVRFIGLQIYQTALTTRDSCGLYVSTGATSSVHVESCIFIQDSSTNEIFTGVRNDLGVLYIWNSIFLVACNYNWSPRGACVLSNNGSATIYIYSSTCVSKRTNGYGVNNASGTITAKNCYAKGTASVDYAGTITKTTCASADSTGSEGLRNIAYNTTNFTNVTGGSENLHIPSGSALKDVGTDTSGDSAPLNFTTDIDGQTRSGSWDIGADEYVAAAAAGGVLKRYSGAAWDQKVLKRYSGAAWDTKTLKRWTGTAWVTVDTGT